MVNAKVSHARSILESKLETYISSSGFWRYLLKRPYYDFSPLSFSVKWLFWELKMSAKLRSPKPMPKGAALLQRKHCSWTASNVGSVVPSFLPLLVHVMMQQGTTFSLVTILCPGDHAPHLTDVEGNIASKWASFSVVGSKNQHNSSFPPIIWG